MKHALLVAAVVIGIPISALASDLAGTVTRVHDGDTFSIGKQRIRVYGIDAPELNQQCRADAINEPGPSPCVPCGHMSQEALSKLIMGKQVHCIDRGKSYDRVVGECAVGEIQIGPWMLSNGWAVAYPQYLHGVQKREYLGAESGAKRANAGIWSTTFVPPSDWRNHKQRLECER